MAKKIKLFFDQRPISNNHRFRGIGFYTQELLAGLKKSSHITLVDQPGSANLIHQPYFSPYQVISPFHLGRTIFTVHDLIPLELKQLFPTGLKAKLSLAHNRIWLSKAAHFITDSQASKSSLIKFFRLSPTKITPIYLAPRSNLKPKPVRKSPLNFVLYVGDINPNKNIRGLVGACLQANLPLKIVGRAAVSQICQPTHPELKDLVWLQKMAGRYPDKIKLLGFVSDQQLCRLYRQALVYLQASFYEGFGLPVLEALKLGCPVISSNRSSLPEIAGSAALYINPYKQEQIVQALKKIKNLSLSQRASLIAAGRLQARRFTWAKTISQTIDVYLSLV